MADQVISSRVANALIEDAGLSSAPLPNKNMLRGKLEAFRQTHGGIWVGGRVTLTESTLEFSPNSLNRSVNTGQLDVRIPLQDVTAVTVESGMITKIITVESSARAFKVRCYGAENFAEQIKAAIPNAGRSQ